MESRRRSRRTAHRFGPRRRHVAILFADITGFTQLVETLPPEDVYARVRPLMDELMAVVRRFDGEIQQVLGDGFMCAFGLRSTRGDEARRAVRAGLALVSTGRELPVHVGIECGEVLVTSSWEPARYGVWGHPVNLAKRLCDLAGPGEIEIGPAAFARAGADVGPVAAVPTQLKGIATAVAAHRITVSHRGLMLSA